MTDSTYFVKSTSLSAFTGSFQHFAGMLQTYFDAEKIYFDKLTGFLTEPSSKLLLIVHTL